MELCLKTHANKYFWIHLSQHFPQLTGFFFYSSLQANRNVHLMDMNALLTVINMMRVYYFFFWSVYWNIYKIWQCISNGVELCLIYFCMIIQQLWLFNLFLLHFTNFFYMQGQEVFELSYRYAGYMRTIILWLKTIYWDKIIKFNKFYKASFEFVQTLFYINILEDMNLITYGQSKLMAT